MRRAVFFDRDGTLIELVHYLVDPDQVAVLPGVPEALRELRAADYCCVVVTNQSVVGRGMLSEAGLEQVHGRLHRELADCGARVDAVYFCPVKPEQDDRTRVEHADRKPGPGMLLRAARDLDLDLTASWMIGDSVSDLLAGRNAGCRGSILVRTGYGASTEDEDHGADHVVDDVKQAAELILRLDRTWSAPRGAREGSTR
jgi:D-glycero-D-manno-heptose 1,7-bisphosphate phosphatase